VSTAESQSPFVRDLREAFEHRFGYALENPILVALSGGADSVALLLALRSAGLEVGAAHLDHTTRDGASTEDARWVEAFAHSLGVPFFTKHVDVPALAEDSAQSFEEVARHVRYDFLARLRRDIMRTTKRRRC
jgi:tRNA(Ile)-lysidine synthase TilS/MesJ